MAPLILHNVPDEELYVGDDGIQRPYAMVFPQYVSRDSIPYLRPCSNPACSQTGRVPAIQEDDARDRLIRQVDAPNKIQDGHTGETRRPNVSCGRQAFQ